VLLGLMDKANSISETMTVQRELQQVQYQIEQIKGQLRVLRDQTSYATIALTLREPGVVAPQPKTVQPSLSEAWARAVAGLLGVVYVVVVGLGYLIPVALLAVALWLIVRRFLRPGPAPARQETSA
jgi:Flp pilus assembly protein TadB